MVKNSVKNHRRIIDRKLKNFVLKIARKKREQIGFLECFILSKIL